MNPKVNELPIHVRKVMQLTIVDDLFPVRSDLVLLGQRGDPI